MPSGMTWLPEATLPEAMQQEELRNIALRRAMQLQEGLPQASTADVADSLTGLALSGGGIRSATFSLGALEAMREQDRLHGIDYLSTVSGGGYVGAWLSANCQRAAERRDAIDSGHIPAAIAGNRQYRTTYAQAAQDWLARAACLAAAGLLCRVTGYDPFEDRSNSLLLSLLTAIPLMLAGLCLLPAGVRLARPLLYLSRRLMPGWISVRAPRRIDYGQGATQALVIVPLLLTGFFLAAVMSGLSTGAHGAVTLRDYDSYGRFFLEGWRYWPFPLTMTFVALSPLSYFSRIPQRRSLPAALLAPLPAMLVLHALLASIMLLMHGWANLPDQQPGQQGAWHALVWGPSLVLYAFALTIVVQIGMMGRQSPEGVREWWSRLGAWLLVYGAVWMLVSVAAVFGPLWSTMALRIDWLSWPALGGWVASTLAGLMAGNAGSTQGPATTGAEPTLRGRVLNILAVAGPYVFIVGVVIGVATLLHVALLYAASATGDNCCTLSRMQQFYWRDLSAAPPHMVLAALGGIIVAAALFAWRVDINVFSLNSFYRGRLSRCYLGATRFVPRERTPQRFTLFDDDDDLPLHALAGGGLAPTTGPQAVQAGPLHIVCCALNLGGSSDLSLHSRHAASFVLTPYRAGSGYYLRTECGGYVPLGYQPFVRYCGKGAQPTLAQAIAVSGAAASPNMGYHTSPGTAFMLTMFNVRLGWWFPNPKLAHIHQPSPSFSVRYLVKELFGAAEARSNYLMVSDGGHFENLAVHELVRRRCKVIIASDAECDRHYRFDGLGTLIRMCEVDFGVKIAIDFTDIAQDGETPWVRRRFAVGRIDYGGGEQGVLIYLKASMTGKEDAAVLQYKARHERFPHESTGDQFYGEDQFESYRHLGYDIAQSLFAQVAAHADLAAAAQALLRKYGAVAGVTAPDGLGQRGQHGGHGALGGHPGKGPGSSPPAVRPLHGGHPVHRQHALRHGAQHGAQHRSGIQ